MAKEISKVPFNSETVGSMLRFYLSEINRKVTEHLDDRTANDGQTEHPYCTLDEREQSFVDLLWNVIEWKAADTFIDKNGELDEILDPRFNRLGKHKHECGQRMTSSAVVVESA